MHTTNYTQTLILPAPDCPAPAASVPGKPGTVAAMQYERLAAAPYGLTSDALIFAIHAERLGLAADAQEAARAAFFSKGQACLRASPLVKTFGWALHHDAEARVALVDPQSEIFARLTGRDDIVKLAGMRNKRAQGK